MAGRSLTDRVEVLEQKVEGLRSLPAKVDALTNNVSGLRTEFSQFRTENDVAHSATRDLIGQMHEHAMTRLQGVEDTMSQRFNAVDIRFDGMDRRLDGIDGRFDGVDARLDRVERQLDVILSRLPPR